MEVGKIGGRGIQTCENRLIREQLRGKVANSWINDAIRDVRRLLSQINTPQGQQHMCDLKQ